MTAGVAALKVIGDAGGLGAEIHGLQVYLGSRYPGQVQEVVNEAAHPLAGRRDACRVATPGLVETVAVLFGQGVAESTERPQWVRRSCDTE